VKVKSTGLGKTQLTSDIDGFYIKEDGSSAVMVIESTEPVHWHIECDMGGDDLRQFARLVLKPRTLASLIGLLIKGGEAKGFVMEKEKGGRRGAAKKARVTARTVAGTVPSESAAPAAAVTATAAPAVAPNVAAQTPAAGNGHGPAESVTPSPPPLVDLVALREAEASHRDGERAEREQRRAERRRQREQATQVQPTAG
jgi:hypothetical protein